MNSKSKDPLFPDRPIHQKVEHLTYLNRPPSLFEDESDEAWLRARLVCASCGHYVTTVSEKKNVFGRHDHAFPYFNHVVQLGSYAEAPGCNSVERVSYGYSWFRGYAWQIQVCENCYTQLGWKYTSPDDSFYGLVFKTLREETPQEQERREAEKDDEGQ